MDLSGVGATNVNFRLTSRLIGQIERILRINQLAMVTKEVVEAARENLVIGGSCEAPTGLTPPATGRDPPTTSARRATGTPPAPRTVGVLRASRRRA